jgi:nucleotide-binding universal stress UspA family protein
MGPILPRMKTILVPVDLTAAAEHTVVYANKLAVRLGAEVVLLYCHHGPALSPEATADYRHRLQTLAERLRYVQLVRQDGRRIRYQLQVRPGCLHDCVQQVIDECGAELVVMNQEHIDCGEASISGNHAARIAELASCPVLVVPAGARPLPTRVAFLADFGALSPAALPGVADLARGLRAQLQLVHFYRRLDFAGLMGIKKGIRTIREAMPDVPIDSRLVLDDDPLEGISECCAHLQAQLLIFAPASPSQLRRLFDVCYAKTQAYHTRIPVLVLPPARRPAEAFCCEQCAGQVGEMVSL